MNILMVAPCSLDAQTAISGFGNRVQHLARALSCNNAKVTILHFGTTTQENRNFRMVSFPTLMRRTNSKNLLVGAIDRYLSSINASLTRAIKELTRAERPDILQVESPHPFAPSYLAKRLSIKTLISLDEHNTEFLSVLSKWNKRKPFVMMSTGMSLPYVFVAESFAVNRSDTILSVSRNDAQSLMALYRIREDKIWIIPNGVDTSIFSNTQKPRKETLFGTRRKVILFHGTFSWYPNLEAASMIVDFIALRIPQACFVICGSDLPSSFLHRISKLGNTKYAGYVQDIAKYITNTDVCIAPILRGGGTKLKILEYAAAGKPIVATYKATEGLPLVNGVNALLFENIGEDFINGIRRVLSDDVLAEKIGSNARQLAVKFDWKVIGNRLYDKYTSLLQSRK